MEPRASWKFEEPIVIRVQDAGNRNRHAIHDCVEAIEFLKPHLLNTRIAVMVESAIKDLREAMRGASVHSPAELREIVVKALGDQVIGA